MSCCSLSTTWDGGAVLWSVQVCSRSPSANWNGSPRCQSRGNQVGLLRQPIDLARERVERRLGAVAVAVRERPADAGVARPRPAVALDRAALGAGQRAAAEPALGGDRAWRAKAHSPRHRRRGPRPAPGRARAAPAAPAAARPAAPRTRAASGGARGSASGGASSAVWQAASGEQGEREAGAARHDGPAQRRSRSPTSHGARRRSGQP